VQALKKGTDQQQQQDGSVVPLSQPLHALTQQQQIQPDDKADSE
jgi:hypothetical protein